MHITISPPHYPRNLKGCLPDNARSFYNCDLHFSANLSRGERIVPSTFSEPVSWLSWILNLLVLLAGVFLIFLVLIQRGKGGGLAGAFGGAGGSSPFGSRAGDLFTRITIIAAAVWIILIMVHVKVVQYGTQKPAEQTESALPQ
jgi:preprotein translocase subunit SecG